MPMNKKANRQEHRAIDRPNDIPRYSSPERNYEDSPIPDGFPPRTLPDIHNGTSLQKPEVPLYISIGRHLDNPS